MAKIYILKMHGLIDQGYRRESLLLVWRIPMGCDGGNTGSWMAVSDVVSPG
ncbi:hypothetical protein FOC1_g10005084 [Fusarium oxysporum f. sp. cubense race 1]|uniref:Uncharacterized protein n=1 Tax=Fusarium oxysporum f. sp. cubense (strain race 1) TaxID=1229664 RepID=N4U4G8_FUSC1|nr:hypothetical protein FOC1_g10005084 [Fusarium oxysporum f. sp. cubense race 1]